MAEKIVRMMRLREFTCANQPACLAPFAIAASSFALGPPRRTCRDRE
jgi:hypothetical protein